MKSRRRIPSEEAAAAGVAQGVGGSTVDRGLGLGQNLGQAAQDMAKSLE